jgi:hypothetical protein
MLVSLHMPKTAGTSFAFALRRYFVDALVEDYEMLPINRPRGVREWEAVRTGIAVRRGLKNGVSAIHGHFLPVKYAIALRGREVHYVTWLRDPVERLLSNYHFWRHNPRGASPAQPLRYRMLQEDWSLERFCLGPEFRNLYHQYLWGFPLGRFAFVGITERYEEDLDAFAARFLDGIATATHARTNPERDSDRYRIEPSLRTRIERHHAKDMALYRRARDRVRA